MTQYDSGTHHIINSSSLDIARNIGKSSRSPLFTRNIGIYQGRHSPGFLLVTRDARGLARISTHHSRCSGTRLSGPRPARRLAHRELAYHGLAPLADSLVVNSSITDSPRLGTRPKRLRHRRLAYRRLATLGDSPAAASPSWAHLLRTRPRGLAMIGSRHSSKSGIRHSPISGSHCAPEHTIIEPQAASTRRLKPRGLLPLGIFR